MDEDKAIGIIGFGNMGSSIAQGLKSRYPLFVFDKDKNKTKATQGIKALDSLADLASRSDILILAVKPQDFDGVLTELKDKTTGKLIISIAAGITTSYIEKQLPQARVVRAMPNIGVKIGESVTCICAGRFATGEDLACAQELFGHLGKTLEIKEAMMNASTAISGSGPGYFFYTAETKAREYNVNPQAVESYFKDSLSAAAEEIGFGHKDAEFLAVNTSNTSILLLVKTKISAGELKKQVASKGGTTEAGLTVLEKGGSLKEAVKAALKRAEELAQQGNN